MSWSRGLFRLWIVSTALWIILVVSIGWSDVTSPYYSGHVITVGANSEKVFDKYSTESYDLQRGKDAGEFNSYEVDGVNGTRIYMMANLSAIEVASRMERAAPLAIKLRDDSNAAKIRENYRQFTMLAVVPPLALLALGSALVWVARGFRK